MTLSNLSKVQNLTKKSICHRTINHKNFLNVPSDTLMCPLQIINDIESVSLTLHGVNSRFIHHPSNVKNYSISHKSETTQQKKNKKKVHPSYIFLHLCAKFWVKIQNTHHYRNGGTFWTSGQSALNSPANSSEVTYLKIQNRLSKAP